MKATKSILSSFMFVLLTFSCTMIESNPLKKGEWKITQYNINEFNPFLDFRFEFSRKSVTASKSKKTKVSSIDKSTVETKNFTSVSGTYSLKTNHGTRTLFFDFGTASPFDKLNHEWLIIEESSTKIKLQNVKDNLVFLVFEKNSETF